MSKLFYNIFSLTVIFSVLMIYSFAAGSGGGGASYGLGFNSRDAVSIISNGEYSTKFSLNNGTNYNLRVNANNDKTALTFGSVYVELKTGDNYVDLNDNGFADINFRLESVKGKRFDVTVIDAKDSFQMQKEKANIADNSREDEKKDENIAIKCSNLVTLKERVACRLELGKEEQENELELYYLPEECRVLTGSAMGKCIARYKSVQTCWKFPIGNARVSCVKKVLRLGFIGDEKEACNKLSGQEKLLCVEELKNKVYNLVKWHFYNLEERAEDLMKRGFAGKNDTIDFVAETEQNKNAFNNAKSYEERKSIILNVKSDWNIFIGKVKGNARGQIK